MTVRRSVFCLLAVLPLAGACSKKGDAAAGGAGPGAASGAPEHSNAEIVWVLGHKIALAALGNARGADPETVGRTVDATKTLAGALGVEIPPLPENTGDEAKDGAAALHYLLEDLGKSVSGSLGKTIGKEAASLFELAIKSELLNILYVAGDTQDSTVKAIGDAMTRAAGESGLPEPLWKPLLDAIGRGAPFDEVQDAVKKMKDDVGVYLQAAG